MIKINLKIRLLRKALRCFDVRLVHRGNNIEYRKDLKHSERLELKIRILYRTCQRKIFGVLGEKFDLSFYNSDLNAAL